MLIVAGLITAVAYSIETGGWKMIGTSLGNIIFPIVLLYFFFLIHVIGAGDIKLFAVLGAFLGKTGVLQVVIYAFLVGGIYALIRLVKRRKLIWRLFVFREYALGCYRERRVVPYSDVDQSDVMCFSVTIFVAYVVNLIVGAFGGSLWFNA